MNSFTTISPITETDDNNSITISSSSAKTPWVEKYKPLQFEDVILSDINRQIFCNVLEHREFPNMLFYGPPGTGKTTTIINLVKKFHEILGQKHKALTIHLNASDDRGVEIVRTQIHQFVHMKQLFFPGVKFVILDEVDYMTDIAQQTLRHIIQTTTHLNVRFCLICNYIGKINENLQNDFIKVRFNQLPGHHILSFLKNISNGEKLKINDSVLTNIQIQFKSDIRSMINMLQTCASTQVQIEEQIINPSFFQKMFQDVCKIKTIQTKNINSWLTKVKKYSTIYNISEANLMKELIKYIVWNYRCHKNCSSFMDFAEKVFHSKEGKNIVIKTFLEIHSAFAVAVAVAVA